MTAEPQPLEWENPLFHQALAQFEQAGFSKVQLTHKFTFQPALPEDDLFCILAVR